MTREEIDKFEAYAVADTLDGQTVGIEVAKRQVKRIRAFCNWARSVLDAADGTQQHWANFQLECDKPTFKDDTHA